MRRRIAAITAVGLGALALGGATSASAASRVGSECTATTVSGTNVTAVQAEFGGEEAAVVSDGVATRWIVPMSLSEPDSLAQQLKVLRPAGSLTKYKVVAESSYQAVVNGTNVFATRIPVHAGDHFGLSGSAASGSLACAAGVVGEASAKYEGNPPVGTTQTFSYVVGSNTPLAVDVEPDVDGDGYGDETQDGCPADASTQGACPEPPSAPPASPPLPKLSVQGLALRAGGRAIRLFVAASRDASVIAGGQVGWRIKAKKRKPGRRIFGLSGGRRSVSPGQVAAFTVRLPRAVLRHLRRLPSKQSLRAKLSVVATDSSGQTARDPLVVKLRGLARRG